MACVKYSTCRKLQEQNAEQQNVDWCSCLGSVAVIGVLVWSQRWEASATKDNVIYISEHNAPRLSDQQVP